MTVKHCILPLVLFVSLSSVAQRVNESVTLSSGQILEDLAYLDSLLQFHSSYQGLNGYSYQPAFQAYRDSMRPQISQAEFGLFLTRVIGQLGDRHASVRNYDLPNTKFLPFVAAPLDDNVVALTFAREDSLYHLKYPKYPYLKTIDGIPMSEFLAQIIPEELKAPPAARFARAVKQLKYLEKNYVMLGKTLPNTLGFTFTNGTSDTTLQFPVETNRRTHFTWDEKFARLGYREEELNDIAVAQTHFLMDEDSIAYLRLPEMVEPNEVPIFFRELRAFMETARSSKALIVDLRSNGGGSRHLIWELAGYVVHPDSIYVVNVAQQRTDSLDQDKKEDLYHRYLFAPHEVNRAEQHTIRRFQRSFQPMYLLPEERYSAPHYALFNGQKARREQYHYTRPVYLLINEKSFSAASVMAATFKGLPNVTLVGVATDGSSGNSESFRLPHSGLRVKLSTMVAFQKDGRPLDGYGTSPDTEIHRNLGQVLWKEDYQLEQLKQLIHEFLTTVQSGHTKY